MSEVNASTIFILLKNNFPIAAFISSKDALDNKEACEYEASKFGEDTTYVVVSISLFG